VSLWWGNGSKVTAQAIGVTREMFRDVEPVIDEARLLPCAEAVLGAIEIPRDAELPVVVDVELERHLPATEGGVVGGVP
jgi:hypothetical protein